MSFLTAVIRNIMHVANRVVNTTISTIGVVHMSLGIAQNWRCVVNAKVEWYLIVTPVCMEWMKVIFHIVREEGF